MLKNVGCGELNLDRVGETVILAGWVHRRRDHGNLVFIDVRDRSGIVQVVFDPDIDKNSHEVSESLRNEWVIQVEGEVIARSEGTINPDLKTGYVELHVSRIVVLNESLTPPFYVNEESEVDEM